MATTTTTPGTAWTPACMNQALQVCVRVRLPELPLLQAHLKNVTGARGLELHLCHDELQVLKRSPLHCQDCKALSMVHPQPRHADLSFNTRSEGLMDVFAHHCHSSRQTVMSLATGIAITCLANMTPMRTEGAQCLQEPQGQWQPHPGCPDCPPLQPARTHRPPHPTLQEDLFQQFIYLTQVTACPCLAKRYKSYVAGTSAWQDISAWLSPRNSSACSDHGHFQACLSSMYGSVPSVMR